MKKLIFIIGALAAIIALLWLVGSRTRFDVPGGFELGADTPADLVRTIYNPIFDDTVTFKKFSYETGGEYTLLEIDLAPGGDTRVPGIMNILNPLFKRAANRAERSGLQDELLERYFFSNVEAVE